MSNRRQTIRKAFSREFGKVVNQSNRSELGNNISTLNLGDQGYHCIVQAGDIDSTKTEALDNITNQLFQLGPEFPKERNREAVWPRSSIRISRVKYIPYFLIRKGNHQ